MRTTYLLVLLAMALATNYTSGQNAWQEVRDAPEGPVGVIQETVGAGPLQLILGAFDGASGDYVDTYAIVVEDPATFRVEVPSPPFGEALASHRMWLWTDATRGPSVDLVMANDSGPIVPPPQPGCETPDCTLLTDPDTWPGGANGLIDEPQNVTQGGRYLLSISYGEASGGNDPLDDVGTPLADLDDNPLALVGPNPAAVGGFASWENNALRSEVYAIALSGVTFSDPGAGDFNDDGTYDCVDVDQLVGVIATGGNDPIYDLTGDGIVDTSDLDQWRAEAGSVGGLTASGHPVQLGDANLDGFVDGSDFIQWNANKFTSTAAWCAGDFNADGIVDGSDFIVWNIHKFTAADHVAVPEPTSLGILAVTVGIVMARRRREFTS